MFCKFYVVRWRRFLKTQIVRCNWFGTGNNRIPMKQFHCVQKLPHMTADDQSQPFWLLRVHGKPLRGHAFVTVAALLVLGLMAVVFFVLSSCNCCYPCVSMSFVWITVAYLPCALLLNSTCLSKGTKKFAWARTAISFHGLDQRGFSKNPNDTIFTFVDNVRFNVAVQSCFFNMVLSMNSIWTFTCREVWQFYRSHPSNHALREFAKSCCSCKGLQARPGAITTAIVVANDIVR